MTTAKGSKWIRAGVVVLTAFDVGTDGRCVFDVIIVMIVTIV